MIDIDKLTIFVPIFILFLVLFLPLAVQALLYKSGQSGKSL